MDIETRLRISLLKLMLFKSSLKNSKICMQKNKFRFKEMKRFLGGTLKRTKSSRSRSTVCKWRRTDLHLARRVSSLQVNLMKRSQRHSLKE